MTDDADIYTQREMHETISIENSPASGAQVVHQTALKETKT